MTTKNKVLLMILDGWGIGDQSTADAITAAKPRFINSLMHKYPHSELLTSGENVGLPDGQMGNSEVGHQNIGAGRVIYQDLVKINIACRDNSISSNAALVEGMQRAADTGGAVHFMGLVSDGGVHSSMDHLVKLCHVAQSFGVDSRTYIHAFMDGRDTDPRSGKGFLVDLQSRIADTQCALASIVGRYYAMDRDKRWERVKVAYDLLTQATTATSSLDSSHTSAPISAADAMQQMYDRGITDEFAEAVSLDKNGVIKAGDTVVFFNFRNDRAKELTIALTQCDMPEHGMAVIDDLFYCTMTPYDAGFHGLHIMFDKDNISNTLGEYISAQGLTQLRIAETEKFAHVTFFFNGGREKPFEGEHRILINSPKVATYDLQPEMSVREVTAALIAELHTTPSHQSPDFVCLNFANGDMVGHTGVYDAIVRAVRAVDECVEQVVGVAQAEGYTVFITADHGNADFARNADGSPNTAHSLNPVPFIVIPGANVTVAEVHNGVLADIAPTVLKVMGLPQPSEMTGHALV